jgi:hypothetical protein
VSSRLPISAFTHALRAFHSGDLSHDELSCEIDRQLAVEKASPIALLEVLEIHQVAQPLPSEAHEAIVQHLEEWPRDPTIVTGLKRRPRTGDPTSVGVGDILQGRFSLAALIGEGGMSRVFKAVDLRRIEAGAEDPYVAVKVLTEAYGDYFGSIVALQRETHKLQSLSHPNIVRVIDCDRDVKTVFMTMEYLAGESLQKKLRAPNSGGFAGDAAVSIVTTIGSALEYAHRNRIVHGDLKPGNIIVTDTGMVKVIDFGMARFIARPDEVLPPRGQGRSSPKAVTPRYASPEMVAGHDPEPADDVYALACIAYETLSGRHPFGRLSDPCARDPHTRPPRPRGMRRRHYAALVKALAFDRRQRTPTVRQFLDDFLGAPRAWWRARWPWLVLLAMFCVAAATATATAAATAVSRLQVRVVTGALELSAGSVLELRIYEAGRPVRHLPLAHGEAWARDSTRLIPLSLTEPLDPRSVSRFALYYRAASPLTPPWEVVEAEVDLSTGREPPQRLLDATLSGTMTGEGELATPERDASAMTCGSDADCDDHRSCNGRERCAPHSAGADARGCVKGQPLVCPVNEVCAEGRGCVGTAALGAQ